jgi:hypothetical protein
LQSLVSVDRQAKRMSNSLSTQCEARSRGAFPSVTLILFLVFESFYKSMTGADQVGLSKGRMVAESDTLIGLDALTCERVALHHERQLGAISENNITAPRGGDCDVSIPYGHWLRRRCQRANANTTTAVRADHIGMHEGRYLLQ